MQTDAHWSPPGQQLQHTANSSPPNRAHLRLSRLRGPPATVLVKLQCRPWGISHLVAAFMTCTSYTTNCGKETWHAAPGQELARKFGSVTAKFQVRTKCGKDLYLLPDHFWGLAAIGSPPGEMPSLCLAWCWLAQVPHSLLHVDPVGNSTCNRNPEAKIRALSSAPHKQHNVIKEQ